MKRRRGDGTAVPERLARFVLDEWSPAGVVPDVSGAFGSWRQARAAWVAAGNSWPDGEVTMQQQELDAAVRLPDQPLPFLYDCGHR